MNCRLPRLLEQTRRRGDTETRRGSSRPCVPASPRLPAFTLVEVLVSIVIALLLIVGISKIFGIAQQSSGMGTSLLKINDTTRTIQSVLRNDFQNMVTDPKTSPGFVIASYPTVAFRNAQDFQQGPDQLHPLIFPLPGQSLGTIATASFCQAYVTNYRVHRTDRMCFFETGQFQRQTGDSKPNGDANIVTPFPSATEALVWIGHLATPNNPAVQAWDPRHPDAPTSGDYFGPGSQTAARGPSPTSGSNDNNNFASSWILGRCVTLLTTPSIPNPPGNYFIDTPTNYSTVPLSLMARAAAQFSTSAGPGQAAGIPNYASRTDVLYDTQDPLTTFRNTTQNLGNGSVSTDGYFWWEDLIGLAVQRVGGAFTQRGGPACQPYFANPLPTKPAPGSPAYSTWSSNPSAWLSAAAAQTAPIFVRGCSQFIVEFAGDYAQQDPITGQFLGAGQDGQIDFIVDQSNSTDPTQWTRRIRWYGFPRDTSSPTPKSPNAFIAGPPIPDGALEQYDVIPVKWYIVNTPPGVIWFERAIPPLPTSGFDTGNTSMPINAPTFVPNLAPFAGPAYIAAWGPDIDPKYRPKLIRITIAIDEPTGRLNTEQTYEFIFALP